MSSKKDIVFADEINIKRVFARSRSIFDTPKIEELIMGDADGGQVKRPRTLDLNNVKQEAARLNNWETRNIAALKTHPKQSYQCT